MTEHPHDSDPTGSIAEAQQDAVRTAVMLDVRRRANREAAASVGRLLNRTTWSMWAVEGRLVVEWDDRGFSFAYWLPWDEAHLAAELQLLGQIRAHHLIVDVLEVVRNTASHLTGWLAENSALATCGSCAESLPGVSASPTLTPGTDSIDLDVIDLRDR
jgi:hypothetical protein